MVQESRILILPVQVGRMAISIIKCLVEIAVVQVEDRDVDFSDGF